MESELSGGGPSSEFGFSFAFNDSKFSDTVLRLEIIPDPVDAPPNSDTPTTIADWARHCKKRPLENGDEAATNNDSNWTMDCSAAKVVRVKTLHISSAILAAKSPFFYKLFSNEMSESEQRNVTLRITASEEAALMELLKFMYSNTLNITAAPALLDVLMAADKFEVPSCMRYCCSQLLRNLPMTLDSALLYLELPHTVLMADAVQPLSDAAKQYLVGQYKDIAKFKEEVMALPLSGIEAILASDDLQVVSEDVVYDFVLKWARQHYKQEKERREVLGTRLARLIRFPYMTCRKLEKVFFTNKDASKLVLEALFFKAQQSPTESASLNCRFLERAYNYKLRPVKVVEFELPRQQCVVYLDLKREECAALFPSRGVKSESFDLGGQSFRLAGVCMMDIQRNFHYFMMGVGMRKKCSGRIVVDCEFAARSRLAEEEFIRQYKKSHKTFTGGMRRGCDLFGVPWTEFMAEDSPFFINGILHLKAEFTIRD